VDPEIAAVTAPSTQTVFQVTGLSKRFGGIAALSDVSFSVRAGEALGLIGPNGAGKTTLFECVAGGLPADEGTVHVAGRSLGSRRTEQARTGSEGLGDVLRRLDRRPRHDDRASAVTRSHYDRW